MVYDLESRDGFASMMQDLFRYADVNNKDVAKLMAVHERTVKNWLDGYSQPSPSDTIKLFRLLNVPMIPFLTGMPEQEDDRTAIIHYINNAASSAELRDMRFNLTEKHGSSVACQLALVSALNHMKLRYRLMVAKMVLNLWEIASAENGLQNTEEAMPDIDKVKQACIKSHYALQSGKNSYTDI